MTVVRPLSMTSRKSPGSYRKPADVKDCTAKRGSVSPYCGCVNCLAIRRRYTKAKALGTVESVDSLSKRAWALIDKRMSAGWSPLAIQVGCDLPKDTLRTALQYRKANGQHRWNRRNSLIILKALTSTDAPTVGRVPSIGAFRRLEALRCIGYSTSALATESGVPIGTIRGMFAKRNGYEVLDVKTFGKIVTAYDRLSVRPLPDSHYPNLVRADAQRRGYLPPASWDEDIDDPDSGPIPSRERNVERLRTRAAGFELAADAGSAKRQAVRERRAKIRELHVSGLSHRKVSVQLRLTQRMVERDIQAMREEGML